MFRTLFAAGDGGLLCIGWCVFMLFILACVGGFRLWLMIHRPEIYRDMVQREHERAMAERSRKKARSDVVMGLGSFLLNRYLKGR